MRNNSKSAMLRMSSSLESRSSPLHLWTSLGRRQSESSQNFHQWRLDAFSIPKYVINKERPRGARHDKTEAQKEHFVAHNARRRCLKKNVDGNHDRFQRDPVFRDSQLKNWLDRGEVHRNG